MNRSGLYPENSLSHAIGTQDDARKRALGACQVPAAVGPGRRTGQGRCLQRGTGASGRSGHGNDPHRRLTAGVYPVGPPGPTLQSGAPWENGACLIGRSCSCTCGEPHDAREPPMSRVELFGGNDVLVPDGRRNDISDRLFCDIRHAKFDLLPTLNLVSAINEVVVFD